MVSAQTLSLDDRRLVAVWAADCADEVAEVFEAAAPADVRVRVAIQQTRDFASGAVSVADAIRRRGAQAGAAARDVDDPAAKAAAYAAEQAAAVAHIGAHALGAAGYVLKARLLHSPGASLDDEAQRLASLATDDAAAALAALPAVGTAGSGTLGPGRLSSGMVGEAIRVLQATIRVRTIARRTAGP